ncbi:interleukin-22-like [Anguilla rostrata]|uniref:interleukin-22-like n=1 Tax=Anguilla anguilla TaxID=7936 RepID=UPI0015AE6F2A|nr:interleukin-22-like [Anguilla anguilla]
MKWTVLVAVTVLCCLWRDAGAGVIKQHPKSAPLRNPHTHQRVRELAQHAQNLDNDTDTRLMPPANHSDSQTNLYICCLHANILDFYLLNILTTQEVYPHLASVRAELHRVSRDLERRGCSINHVKDHEHSKRFKEEFFKLGKKGETKAIGEIDILFDYLSRYC